MPAKKKIKVKAIEYNSDCDPKLVHGYSNVRWVENVSRGLRFVGFADEIDRTIYHNGWYTDDDFHETYRGVVYRLPSRGESLYVFGYADPGNEDCALLCFDPEHDRMDAARAADRFAAIFAEEAREYNRAWQARQRCEDLADEIGDMRRRALAIGEEMRRAKHVNLDAPMICATLRAEIKSLYCSIQKARKERSDLIDTYGRQSGFADN